MTPRLAAEESLMAARDVALGTGSLKRETAATVQRELERRARGRDDRRPADAQAFAALGFTVEKS